MNAKVDQKFTHLNERIAVNATYIYYEIIYYDLIGLIYL